VIITFSCLVWKHTGRNMDSLLQVFFYNSKQLLNLYHYIILKLWRQFIKEAGHTLEFFRWCSEKHISRAVFKPHFTYSKGQRYKMDYPVINLSVGIFQIRNIPVADKNSLSKLGLRYLEGDSEVFYPIINGHWSIIVNENSQNKAFFSLNESIHWQNSQFEV